MSKAACVTEQIRVLQQITCKHTVSNLAQKQFCISKKLHILGWGLTTSPATPAGPHLLPAMSPAPSHLLGKVSTAKTPQDKGMGVLLQLHSKGPTMDKTAAQSGLL